MIKPEPLTILCTQCGWQKTVLLNSDVLTDKLIPSACPQCGYIHLSYSRATAVQQIIAKMKQFLSGRLF